MTVSCVAEPCDAMQLDLRTAHKGVQRIHPVTLCQSGFDDFDD